MEKTKEIELLKQLKGDTYFADTFSAATIDKMCDNIKNDFPILLNSEYATKQMPSKHRYRSSLRSSKSRRRRARKSLTI